MKMLSGESKKAVKSKITKIDPLKRMWIFGTIILLFSIFAEPKIIPAIFLFMLILTFAQYKSKKKNAQQAKIYIAENIEEITVRLDVVYEHINSGNATLEEKLVERELEDELEQLVAEDAKCDEDLAKIARLEEKFKNFLVKFKKPSKMITAGEKEKEIENKEKI